MKITPSRSKTILALSRRFLNSAIRHNSSFSIVAQTCPSSRSVNVQCNVLSISTKITAPPWYVRLLTPSIIPKEYKNATPCPTISARVFSPSTSSIFPSLPRKLDARVKTQLPILVKGQNIASESKLVAECFEQIVRRIDEGNIKTPQNAQTQLQIMPAVGKL